MVPLSRRLQVFVNREAGVRLAQLGHSDPMVGEAKRQASWWLQARIQAAKRRVGLLRGQGIVWPVPGRAELVSLEAPRPGVGEVAVEVATSIVSPGTER